MNIEANLFKEFKKCIKPIHFSQKYFLLKKYPIEKREVIECIEKIDWLGALYVAILQEPDYASEYINGFWKRNSEIIIKKIQINNELTYQYMQMLYLCLMYLENGEAICYKVFSGNIYRSIFPVIVEAEGKRGITIHYARVFVKAIMQFDNRIPWKKYYCRIAMYIYHAREDDELFLHCLENSLRKIKLGYNIDNEDAKKYFFLLCDNRDFEAASYFLYNFDGSNGFFGIEPKEFINKMYAMPNPAMLALARWYEKISLGNEINYDEWYDRVVELNHDEECLKWIKITVLFGHLRSYAVDDDWDSLINELDNVVSCPMFDLDKINYIKQIIKAFAYIVNKMILSNNCYLKKFIERIEKVNVNSFANIKYTKTWNLLEDVENYDYKEILKELFKQYDCETATYIYMNSHLKNVIKIEEFVKIIANNMGNEIGCVFKDYPLAGYIIGGNKLNAIRNKLYIVPNEIASDVSYNGYKQTINTYGYNSKETINYMKNMIRSDEGWYSHNKEVAQLIIAKDICTFIINSYDERNGILAVDFKLREDVQRQRLEYRNNTFPEQVIKWLKKIEESKKYFEWNQKETIFGIQFIEDTELRSDVALQILRSIIALKDDVKELKKLLFSITNAPVEEINEFRYIAKQRKLNFRLCEKIFLHCRKEAISMGRAILGDDKISCGLKRDIYLNTCLRRFLCLEEAYKYIGREMFEDSVEPMILSLKLLNIKKASMVFSTKQSNNTFYSKKDFVYFGDKRNLKCDYTYSAILERYDEAQDYFIIKDVDLEDDEFEAWHNYLKNLYDLKKIDFNSTIEIKEISDRIKKYDDIKMFSKEHIKQYAHEFGELMKRVNFSIKKAYKIIEILKGTNPFENTTQDFNNLSREFKKCYLYSYNRFIENYKNNESDVYTFCDVFFKSYLRVVVDDEVFIEDVNNKKYKKDKIIEYCYSKHYIKKELS